MKVAVIYWSGTGNTEQMAQAIAEGAGADLFAVSDFSGKTIALFGSYGWGDGQWMRDWVDRAKADGAVVFGDEGLIVNETPSEEDLENCKQFGENFAK